MSHLKLKQRLFKFVVSSAVSMLAVMIGKKIAAAMGDVRTRQLAEHKLDTALQDSMDCSDAVAKY